MRGANVRRWLVDESRYKVIETAHFRVMHRDMSVTYAQELADRAEQAYRDVSTLLGGRPDKKILMVFRSEDQEKPARANNIYCRIIYPTWRMVNGEPSSPLVQEVTHVVAGRPASGSPLLAEGLAVFMEGLFTDEDAYTSFRRNDLHQVALDRSRWAKIEVSLGLYHKNWNEFYNWEANAKPADSRTAAYRNAGSFAKFLIDRYGLKAFMQVYETGNFKEAFGEEFDALEADWKLLRARLEKRT